MEEYTITKTDFNNLQLVTRGKVRDIYNAGNSLVIVATDRVSAFDVVMDDPVPDKGIILNRISAFWFKKLASIIDNHLVSIDPYEYPEEFRSYKKSLQGRSMLVRKARPLPVESQWSA